MPFTSRESGARWALSRLACWLRAEKPNCGSKWSMVRSAASSNGNIRNPSRLNFGRVGSMMILSSKSVSARSCSRASVGSKRCRPAPNASHDQFKFLAHCDLPRPGEPQITRLAGFSRAGALSRSSSTTSLRPGLVTFIPNGTPELLPNLLVKSGTNLANRAVVVGLRNSPIAAARTVPGLNARHSVVWLPRQRLEPMLLRRCARISASTAPLSRSGSAAAAAMTIETFTPRSAVPRLSSEASSLPEANLRISSSSLVAWRPRWRNWS